MSDGDIRWNELPRCGAAPLDFLSGKAPADLILGQAPADPLGVRAQVRRLRFDCGM
jgi:hypothetical protein